MRAYGCRMSLWCDVLHFYPNRLPAVLHTHACAGRWAEDECESVSWHWCRSGLHLCHSKRIRLCPLDRDSYSRSHHLILTGLTTSLVTQDLQFDPQWVLWERNEALLALFWFVVSKAVLLRHFPHWREVPTWLVFVSCPWTHGINILWVHSHWRWEKCLCCSARLSAPRTAPLILSLKCCGV